MRIGLLRAGRHGQCRAERIGDPVRYSVVNLGCKVNRVESDSYQTRFAESGLEQAPKGQPADIVIVNTCTVTAVAEKKTRKAVRHELAANPTATVLVTGCAAAQSPEVYESMSDRVQVVGKWDMDNHLEAFLADHAPSPSSHGTPSDSFLAPGRTRVGVKVQDGCANECSYCIVHMVRGPELSTDPDEVVAQALRASELGAAEIVLTGINLGRYDYEGLRLAGLLERLLAREEIQRIRLSSIEPDNLDVPIIDLMATSDGRLCRHLHLPLQSGSSKVLSEMARNYSVGFFRDLVATIRERIPSISLSTDVIAGFPGETERDFEDTYRMCEECGFSKMHVFPYSERAGTPAAERRDQIPRDVRLQRAESLRHLGAELRRRDLDSRAGTRELAVVEDDLWCTTESYHAVRRPVGAGEGSLVEVTL